MKRMHCLTRVRFALVLRKIHIALDDKIHFLRHMYRDAETDENQCH